MLFISSEELADIFTGLITGRGFIEVEGTNKRSSHITTATNGSMKSCCYYLQGKKPLEAT